MPSVEEINAASFREPLIDRNAPTTASLRRRLRSELPKHYLRARAAAARSLRRRGETAAADALPQTRPYTLDQIVGDWLT